HQVHSLEPDVLREPHVQVEQVRVPHIVERVDRERPQAAVPAGADLEDVRVDIALAREQVRAEVEPAAKLIEPVGVELPSRVVEEIALPRPAGSRRYLTAVDLRAR